VTRLTLGELNACDREQFVKALGWVFEDSPWVAERAWSKRPFTTLDALHAAMSAEVDAAPPDEQLAVVRAHPDLGTRVRISDVSASEQTGAGLDRLTAGEFERLQTLNGAYHRKFGFPFLLAVKGRTTHDVIAALETRLSRSRGDELSEALRQVSQIARLRLQDSFG
jgi:2-oxo-4-hydroxy-4-carboxy-5-ureidoimidazoline decarboxylase